MKALLINPHDPRIALGRHTWTPLTLVSAAAVLESSACRVEVFDRLAAYHRKKGSLAKVNQDMQNSVRAMRPDLILLITNPYTIFDTCHSARDLRQVYDGPIGLFGSHVSALPAESFAKIPQADLVIQGESEASLPALAQGDREGIPGVWLRGPDGEPLPPRPAAKVDLDALPYPAFHLLDLDYHTQRSTDTIWCHHVSSLTLMTSRGCAGSCAFCLESRRFGSRLRFRSLDLVMEDVGRTLADYKVQAIYFRDCNFLVSRERAWEFCERLIQKGLHKKMLWAAQVRADCVDEELLKLMKRAGCSLLEFGVETPKQSHLENLGKAMKVQAAENALRDCEKAGIFTHAYMMMGLLGETLKDLEASLNWVRKHRPSSYFWQKLHVLPGTPLYETHGESFFENNPWDDQETILNYLFHRNLSATGLEEQLHWLHQRARPLARQSRRVCQLKANSPLTLAGLAGLRMLNRVRFGGAAG